MVTTLNKAPRFTTAEPAVTEPAVTGGVRVNIDNVHHEFRLDGSTLPVLSNFSLDIEPGQFVALLGPSGCGKSTLLRLAAGLDTPTGGRILVDGAEVTGPDPSRVVVFQDPTLYPWRTIWRNAALGLEARGRLSEEKSKVDAALELVGLGAFASTYPHQLSGGMAQRAALARALVNEPRLLILDEPLGKLDSLTRITMQTELVRLWKRSGFTVLLVTHDVEEALFLADRVVVLSDRPANIRDIVTADQPHPRRRDDPELVALRRRVLDLLGVDAAFHA